VQRITRRPEEAYRTALLFDSPTEGVRYAGGRDCGSEGGCAGGSRYSGRRQRSHARSFLRCSPQTRAVVHRTINEGPALGRARGTHLNSSNRVGAPANESQNKPNVVSSRALRPESRTREGSEMPTEFSQCGHIRGVIRQRGAYKGALQEQATMWGQRPGSLQGADPNRLMPLAGQVERSRGG
jgi:hypothetical protein